MDDTQGSDQPLDLTAEQTAPADPAPEAETTSDPVDAQADPVVEPADPTDPALVIDPASAPTPEPPVVSYDHVLDNSIHIGGNSDQLTITAGPDLAAKLDDSQVVSHPMTGVPTPASLVHRDWLHRIIDMWLDRRMPNEHDSWLGNRADAPQETSDGEG